ncbi:uncharacterized protein MONBRDRAFT_23524 [Monosiga brevicollis MX1]|uniref:Uncharacterized protein n=1 Tax=Monosiga brevicollis TaxID=81824 RepID=A9UTN9_MONBE|nr:uncharacterized protein MONBRDRAFT_23524 [Monosiga brevicollis MX1]EDQ91281.1 predicted protein [Monosiga brevicollis MX1]|eukprot:XP_001743703.1 hypothetical protein [Monosiga brevicollis MX1]
MSVAGVGAAAAEVLQGAELEALGVDSDDGRRHGPSEVDQTHSDAIVEAVVRLTAAADAATDAEADAEADAHDEEDRVTEVTVRPGSGSAAKRNATEARASYEWAAPDEAVYWISEVLPSQLGSLVPGSPLSAAIVQRSEEEGEDHPIKRIKRIARVQQDPFAMLCDLLWLQLERLMARLADNDAKDPGLRASAMDTDTASRASPSPSLSDRPTQAILTSVEAHLSEQGATEMQLVGLAQIWGQPHLHFSAALLRGACHLQHINPNSMAALAASTSASMPPTESRHPRAWPTLALLASLHDPALASYLLPSMDAEWCHRFCSAAAQLAQTAPKSARMTPTARAALYHYCRLGQEQSLVQKDLREVLTDPARFDMIMACQASPSASPHLFSAYLHTLVTLTDAMGQLTPQAHALCHHLCQQPWHLVAHADVPHIIETACAVARLPAHSPASLLDLLLAVTRALALCAAGGELLRVWSAASPTISAAQVVEALLSDSALVVGQLILPRLVLYAAGDVNADWKDYSMGLVAHCLRKAPHLLEEHAAELCLQPDMLLCLGADETSRGIVVHFLEASTLYWSNSSRAVARATATALKPFWHQIAALRPVLVQVLRSSDSAIVFWRVLFAAILDAVHGVSRRSQHGDGLSSMKEELELQHSYASGQIPNAAPTNASRDASTIDQAGLLQLLVDSLATYPELATMLPAIFLAARRQAEPVPVPKADATQQSNYLWPYDLNLRKSFERLPLLHDVLLFALEAPSFHREGANMIHSLARTAMVTLLPLIKINQLKIRVTPVMQQQCATLMHAAGLCPGVPPALASLRLAVPEMTAKELHTLLGCLLRGLSLATAHGSDANSEKTRSAVQDAFEPVRRLMIERLEVFANVYAEAFGNHHAS